MAETDEDDGGGTLAREFRRLQEAADHRRRRRVAAVAADHRREMDDLNRLARALGVDLTVTPRQAVGPLPVDLVRAVIDGLQGDFDVPAVTSSVGREFPDAVLPRSAVYWVIHRMRQQGELELVRPGGPRRSGVYRRATTAGTPEP